MAATASLAMADQLPLPPPLPPAASQLLGQAHAGLAEAAASRDPGWRYATAHLAALRAAAKGDGNMIPPMLDAVRAEATLGEICDVLREEWGTYSEPAAF